MGQGSAEVGRSTNAWQIQEARKGRFQMLKQVLESRATISVLLLAVAVGLFFNGFALLIHSPGALVVQATEADQEASSTSPHVVMSAVQSGGSAVVVGLTGKRGQDCWVIRSVGPDGNFVDSREGCF